MDRHVQHLGISCNVCKKENFMGLRYKCLLCYDYDLCAACYDAGRVNASHFSYHPVQCILTNADFGLYYQGETVRHRPQVQSYTCPHCCKAGFTLPTLNDHVGNNHADASSEVICPICATRPTDFNFKTSDLLGHLTVEHGIGMQQVSDAMAAMRTRNRMLRNLEPESRERPAQAAVTPRVITSLPRPDAIEDHLNMLLTRMSDAQQHPNNDSGSSMLRLGHDYLLATRRPQESRNAAKETPPKLQPSVPTISVPNPPEDVAQALVPHTSTDSLLPQLVKELTLQEKPKGLDSDKKQFVRELMFSIFEDCAEKLNDKPKE